MAATDTAESSEVACWANFMSELESGATWAAALRVEANTAAAAIIPANNEQQYFVFMPLLCRMA
jgi:hypothetical protein